MKWQKSIILVANKEYISLAGTETKCVLQTKNLYIYLV